MCSRKHFGHAKDNKGATIDGDRGREVARTEIINELARRGWNLADFARAAGVDVGTVGDLANGSRWPQRATQNKIEAAFEWPPGAIARMVDGEAPPDWHIETVGAPTQDDGVLLSMPPEALEGLSATEREEVIAAARLSALRTAREIRRRLDG